MGFASTPQLPDPDCTGGHHPILLFQTNPEVLSCHTFQQVTQSGQPETTPSTLENVLGLQCRPDALL